MTTLLKLPLFCSRNDLWYWHLPSKDYDADKDEKDDSTDDGSKVGHPWKDLLAGIFLRELKNDWTLAISCALNPGVLRVPKVSRLVTCVNICDMINTYLHKFYSMLNAWNLHHIVHVVCVVCGFVVCEIKWYNENISWNLDFLFILNFT